MLEISSKAKQLCSETLRQLPGEASPKLLRIDYGSGRVAIALDKPQADDEILHHQGRAVLAVPKDFADALSGLTLDVHDEGHLVLG